MTSAIQMSEELLELVVERMTDLLDARLMAGKLTQTDYDQTMRDLNHWANTQSCCAQIWDRVQWRMNQ